MSSSIKISAQMIDAVLPQTQCKECGFPGCMPYAQSLAQGQTTIDRCPPGGVETVNALGRLLNIDPTPYLPTAIEKTRPPALAIIDESECIGCTKCIQACPVDAIVGSAKLMHTIIAQDCTGCGLCIEPCPVDCIELQPLPVANYDADLAREHFNAKQVRQLRDDLDKEQIYRDKRLLATQTQGKLAEVSAKQAYILQAMARSKDKRSHE